MVVGTKRVDAFTVDLIHGLADLAVLTDVSGWVRVLARDVLCEQEDDVSGGPGAPARQGLTGIAATLLGTRPT